MSGSGKTSLGNELVSQLNTYRNNWMIMDGDSFRSILGENLGHTIEDREIIGERLVNLSLEFSKKKKNLIVCVLSIFPEHQKTNRQHIENYKEIFINVSMDNLMKRDNKKIYEMVLKGKIKNVVGFDIDFPIPKNPDLIIDNNKDLVSFTKVAEDIIETFNLKDNTYSYSKKNLLVNKEKYEYSDFLGNSFLDNYTSSRKKTLNHIKNKIFHFISFYDSKKKSSHFLFKNETRIDSFFVEKEFFNLSKNFKEGINSKYLITSWIEILMNNRFTDKNIEKEIIIFIKRFEVSKRIYEGYTHKDFKRIGDEIDYLDVYILFGILLGEFFYISKSKELKIISFNSVLKICDLVESSIDRLTSPCEIFLSEKLFQLENSIYQSLLREIK